MSNRFNLPDVSFFDKSPDVIETEMLFYVEEKTGLTLSNSDPRRKFLQSLVLYISQERNLSDYAFRQLLLAYAEDDFLDHKGEDTLTTRLPATPATTTIEFILEEERVSALVIEAGTLFLVGSDTYFETNETVVVSVGDASVTVQAYCTVDGEVGNGYLPGEISTLVNPLNWVKSVSNVTTSSGGTEIEDDESYANRVRLAPEKFSVAGPDGAYKYWAMSTNQNIVDVEVWSEVAGTTNITVLMKNGTLPEQEVLDKVLDICSSNTVRPLTDKVIVEAPEVIEYIPLATYWISEKNATLVTSIQSNVEQAYLDYLIWQKKKLGRNIDLSELITRLKNAGAHRVQINSEMYQVIEKYQVAQDTEGILTFGGLTDE